MKFTQVQSILFCKKYSIFLADTQNKVRFAYAYAFICISERTQGCVAQDYKAKPLQT